MSISIQNVYRFFLLILIFNVIGLGLELYLIEHFENTRQWVPLVALFLSLMVFITVYLTDSKLAGGFYLLVMSILIIVGLLGVYFHLEENYEFAREMYPAAQNMKIISETLGGATPALAPGSLTGLGLFGIAYYLLKNKNLTK